MGGQLGHGDEQNQLVPKLVQGLVGEKLGMISQSVVMLVAQHVGSARATAGHHGLVRGRRRLPGCSPYSGGAVWSHSACSQRPRCCHEPGPRRRPLSSMNTQVRGASPLLDCLVVTCSLASLLLDAEGQGGAATALRLVRVLRPLRVLSRLDGLRSVIDHRWPCQGEWWTVW